MASSSEPMDITTTTPTVDAALSGSKDSSSASATSPSNVSHVFPMKVLPASQLGKNRPSILSALFHPMIFKYLKLSGRAHFESIDTPGVTMEVPYVVISPNVSYSAPASSPGLRAIEAHATRKANIRKGSHDAGIKFPPKELEKINSFVENKREGQFFFECLHDWKKGSNAKALYKRFKYSGLQFLQDIDNQVFIEKNYKYLNDPYDDIHKRSPNSKQYAEYLHHKVEDFKTLVDERNLRYKIEDAQVGIANVFVVDDPNHGVGFSYLDNLSINPPEDDQKPKSSSSTSSSSTSPTRQSIFDQAIHVFDSIEESTGKVVGENMYTHHKEDATGTKGANGSVGEMRKLLMVGDSTFYRNPLVESTGSNPPQFFIEHETIPMFNILAIQQSDVLLLNLTAVIQYLNRLIQAFVFALDTGNVSCFNINKYISHANDARLAEKTRAFLELLHVNNISNLRFTPLLVLYMYRKARYDKSIADHVDLIKAPKDDNDASGHKMVFFQNVATVSARSLEQVQAMEAERRENVDNTFNLVRQLFGKRRDRPSIRDRLTEYQKPFIEMRKTDDARGLVCPTGTTTRSDFWSYRINNCNVTTKMTTTVRNENNGLSPHVLTADEYEKLGTLDPAHYKLSYSSLEVKGHKFSTKQFVWFYNVITRYLFSERATLVDFVDNPHRVISMLSMNEKRILDMFQ
jgi:hypothetical protein